MRIAFLSDFHLGFKQAGREEEAFENAKQAFELAVNHNADLILIGGDVFHEEVPDAKALMQAMELFSIAKNASNNYTKILKIKKDVKKEVILKGIPIVAIHGTHEFRGKDYVNYLQLFESAGFIAYLHAAKAICTINDEKIVVHGLGGVPEKKALDALKLWDPKPEKNAFNILMLHQSLKELLPFEDEMIATLSIAELPGGFDIIVNGHLHWQNEFNGQGKHLIIPGSTVITQMKRLESKKPKGIYLLDTRTGKLEFLTLPEQRRFFYNKLEFRNASCEEVMKEIKEYLEKTLADTFKKKPLIKIKLTGNLAKGHSQENLELKELVNEFKEKAIISIDTNFFQEQFGKKIAELSKMQSERKSIAELGFDLLEKNLAETNFENAFDVRRIFKLLENGDIDKAREILLNEVKENMMPKNIVPDAEKKVEQNKGENIKAADKTGTKTLSDFV